MKSLRKETDNIGGIAKLYVSPAEYVSDIQATETAGIYSLSLSSTDELYEIPAIPETIKAIQEQRSTPAGLYFENQVQATVAKDTPQLQIALRELTGRRLILILRDQNDRFRLAGSISEPMRLSHKVHSGTKISDLQAADLLFEGRSIAPFPFILNPFT